jgi:hypothetical protein
MSRLWSYSTGVRGHNRIRVYERRDGGPLWVEWYDDSGRHQKPLRDLRNRPILDKDLAKQLAEKMSAAQDRRRDQEQVHTMLGYAPRRTLVELFKAYEDAHPSWSEKHRYDKRASHRFWLRALGPRTTLQECTIDKVKRVVREEAARGGVGFGPRTQSKRLRHIKEALAYARLQLRWITEAEDPLVGLSAPIPKGESKSYTLDEVRRLLRAVEDVDLRVAVICHLAWVTGRRANAILTLHTEAYRALGEGAGMILFPGVTDKARQAGEAPVAGRVVELLEQLLQRPRVSWSGVMFPCGGLDEPLPSTPVDKRWVSRRIRQAEEAAGIPSVPGRGLHGLKRRFATEALRLDPSAASKQAGTLESTLRGHYEQDDLAPKLELARRLADLAEERNT